MKKLIYIAAALVLAACANELEDLSGEKGSADAPSVAAAEPEIKEIVIKLDEETFAAVEADIEKGQVKTKSQGLNSLVDQLDVVSMERVYPDAGQYEESCRKFDMHLFYVVRYRENIEGTKAAELALKSEGIANARAVREVKLRSFNDPLLKYQWHYINTVNAGVDINVKEVWEKYTTGSSNVIVCVVDEAVAYTHPDIADNMWTGTDGKHGYNWSTKDHELAWNGAGDIGHGTHVAGTIAAINNNGIGVCGVAGGDHAAGKPGVQIISCQIFNSKTGECVSDYYCGQAIRYGGLNGAVISQNSWGSYIDDFNGDEVIDEKDLVIYKQFGLVEDLDSAIKWFTSTAGTDGKGNQLASSPMKGGLVFFAAGNDDIDYDPTCSNSEEAIAVGAYGPTGRKASYSNYGDWVDLAAPGGDGVNFRISGMFQPFIYSLGTNNDYVYYNWCGTSMACPHVSGVAALAVSYFGGQGFTSEMLREALIAGSDVYTFKGVEDNKTYPIGRKVNALGIFNYLLAQMAPPEPPAAPSAYTVTASGNTLTYSLSVGKDGKGNPIKTYILLASKDQAALAAANPLNPASGISKATISVSGAVGSAVSGTISALDFSSTYYAAIAAVDSYDQVSALSSIKTVATGENNAPVITTTYTGDWNFIPSESVNIPFKVSDPDSHDVAVSFTTTGQATFTASGSSWYFRLTAKNETYGVERTARITAKDSYGLESYYNITYKVLKPEPPVAPAFSVSVDMNELTFSWKVGEDCFGNKIKSYKLFASKSREDLVGLNPASVPSSVKASTVTVASSAAIGSSLSGSISGLEFDTQYYVSLAAYDANELWSANNTVSDIRTQVNHAPEITTSYTGSYTFLHNDYVNIPFTISDPDGHSFTVAFTSSGKATMSGSGSTRTVTINGSKETKKGTPLTAKITATDSFGLSSEKSFEYTILPNRAPVLSKEFSDHVINGIPYKISMDLSEYFTDPDGDSISYDVLADENIVQISKVGTTLTLASVGYGNAEVTVIASDSGGADIKVTFNVLVRYNSGSVGEASGDEFIVDIYPNPVSRFLYVRGGVNPMDASIRVKSSSGAVVYNDKVSISGFSPCAIDMKNTAPGQYSVTVEAGGNSVTKTVVKR